MNWTLDQLQLFILAVESGSFSAAARKAKRAQSRISTAIANLEADLGFDLFDRSSKLPKLTADGEEMYLEAKAIITRCQKMESKALTMASGEEASLVIAMDEAVPVDTVEQFFSLIAKQYPELKLTVINGSRDDIAIWVDNKRADLGLIFSSSRIKSSLEFTPISQLNRQLIVAKDHPLAKLQNVNTEQLNEYRQLVLCDRMGESREQPVSANHWFVDSYYSISGMVGKGIGWAIVPEHMAKSHWVQEYAVIVPSKLAEKTVPINMGLVKRIDKAKGPVVQWIYSELSSLFELEY